MKTLKLLKPSTYLFCFLAAALVLAMTPETGSAQLNPVIFIISGGFPPCDIGCFSPDGGDIAAYTSPDQVRGATAFVGDVVTWKHAALTGSIFTVTASTTQGDYQGHTCPEPGGLSGVLGPTHNQYQHQSTTVGDCSYRDTMHPPGTGSSTYPGAQGVIHVLPAAGPSAYWLMPANATALPSVAQTFTAFYAEPGGYANLSDSSLTLSGMSRSEVLHYSPVTNKFSLQGAAGDCSPGQAATLTDGYLSLDCSTSSVLTSGVFLQATYNLTPQPTLSGYAYQLTISAMEMGGATRSKTPGSWIVNRPPSASSLTPMDTMGEAGMGQMFTAVYSDPDGYQNIAAANFYMSGNGGMHNEWLHYLAAPNLFTMMGTNDTCSPGQMKMLTNGYLNLDCGSSSISGSGNTLTVIFLVTPQMPSSGIMYDIFTAASDQAGGANAIMAGTWMIE